MLSCRPQATSHRRDCSAKRDYECRLCRYRDLKHLSACVCVCVCVSVCVRARVRMCVSK